MTIKNLNKSSKNLLDLRPLLPNKIISNRKDLIIYYLQGLIAGEGCVKLTKYRSIDSVSIGAKCHYEKEFYKDLFKILDISCKIEEYEISIFNQRNFIKLYNFGIMKLHPLKYKKFLKGMLNFKQFNPEIKEEFLYLKKSFQYELAKILPLTNYYEVFQNETYNVV